MKKMFKSNFDLKCLKRLNQTTTERYNERFFKKGPGAYALGWGRKKYQQKRFFDLIRALEPEDLNGKTVVDIGCGLADLYEFLKEQGFRLKAYHGIDINSNFIEFAREKYPEASFEIRDLLLDNYSRPVADTGVILGVINFKQKKHEEYAQRFIMESFLAVKNVLVTNVISDVHNENYKREPSIYYYQPAKWLSWAQRITPFCSLIHDYAGEPQHEFMLIMRKKPWQETK